MSNKNWRDVGSYCRFLLELTSQPVTIGPMKLIRNSLFLLMAFATSALAQLQSNIEYAVVGGESLKLDAYVPDGKGPFPTAILVHGGGWSKGSKEVFIKPLFQTMSDAGFSWFSINYRLAPTNRYPAAVEDVETAINWVKQHANEYKVDPKRIALIGESAGGHLVALVGARDGRKLGLAAVVPYYAPCELESLAAAREKEARAASALGAFLGFTEVNDAARRLLREASPVTYVTKDLPPFLLIHGDKDPLVPYAQSLTMQERMKQAGAVCELYTVAGGAHGMMGWEKDAKMQEHKTYLIEWVKKTMP